MARKKNPILENIHLTAAGAKGVSVGKTDLNKAILVKNAVPGDVVDVQITKKKRNYLEGKAIHFHAYSDLRTEPLCEHFGVCGGCKWQFMRYDAQLTLKQDEVTQNLKRIGGIETLNVLPIVACKEPYYYRNKMEFSFSNARWLTQDEINQDNQIEQRNALGFHIPGMWSKVLDINQCHLQAEPSNAIRNAVKQFALDHDLSFFDLYLQKGLLRTLMIRTSNLGQIMVLVQFYDDDKEKTQALLHHIQEKFPQITSLLYAINPKPNDSIYDLDIQNHSGKNYIIEEMNGLQFKIGPKSFFQTNSKQALELYTITKQLAGLTGKEVVYDLYTGTGTIAQFVSNQAKKVIGVESVPEAIEAAKENAKINQINNCEFFCGDMKEVFTKDFLQQNGQPDVIITDPPRDGMHKKVIENIIQCAPKKIVYVSCNSATQARDLALLKTHYQVSCAQAVDMFPQTHHVESVVLLERIT